MKKLFRGKKIDKEVTLALLYNDWENIEFLMNQCWSYGDKKYFKNNYGRWYVSYINLKNKHE